MALHFVSSPAPQAIASRLKWTHGASFVCYGGRFGVRSNSAQGMALAVAERPLGWEEISGADVDVHVNVLYSLYIPLPGREPMLPENHLLYAGSELIAQDIASGPVLQKFAQHARLLSGLYARERLFVHAGVVGWKGQAILIPGRSRSGKTSLVKALVERGAVYYSDEYAVLDAEGCVYPYPLPLSIRMPDGSVNKTPITALGGQVGKEPLPVKLIVMTQYAPGAVWNPRTISPSLAMLALMDNTVAARREPQFSMPILRAAVRANTVESKRGDAAEIAPGLFELIDRS